jgi:hypothetical protein
MTDSQLVFAIVAAITFVLALVIFGPIGILAWIAALVVCRYGQGKGWW